MRCSGLSIALKLVSKPTVIWLSLNVCFSYVDNLKSMVEGFIFPKVSAEL